ncbi:MAG: hypothetical protein GY793_08360 [Proteobacteria bacterium]|nr:hypothetical protein [Pseudomonadota bacterium]
MKKKLELIEENSAKQDIKSVQNKKKIRRIFFSLITIAITAGTVVGVSFAIAIVNKNKEKTGELKTGASYSKILKTKNIYK